MVRLSWTENHGDKVSGIDTSRLGLDEAYVILKNGYYKETYFFSAYKECVGVSTRFTKPSHKHVTPGEQVKGYLYTGCAMLVIEMSGSGYNKFNQSKRFA